MKKSHKTIKIDGKELPLAEPVDDKLNVPNHDKPKSIKIKRRDKK
jgi:hypothetical protein